MSCLPDDYLRKTALKTAQTCSYCGVHGPSIELDVVASACLEALTTHFKTTHNEARVVVYERPPAGKDLRETLRQLNVVTEAALDDLVAITLAAWRRYAQRIPEDEADSDDPWFELRSDLHHRVSYEWSQMEQSLQHETRFMNRGAQKLLEQVFHNLHSAQTSSGDAVIIQVGPGCPLDQLIRARVFQTSDAVEQALQHPARHLGTPPPGVGQAGRMNAKGQPAFYGATTEGVAIAEVRPPVGAYAVTALFHITRPLKLLDLAALERVQIAKHQSLLDPASYQLAQTRDFLRTLSRRMVQPVMPEMQDRDYLITQVVADFLAGYEYGPIDGILYPSVQVGPADGEAGFNVVLFPRASRVEEADWQFKAEVQLWTYEEEGPGLKLEPALELPAPLQPEGLDDLADRVLSRPLSDWQPALRIELKRVSVHEVRGVKVQTTPHKLDVRPHVMRFVPSSMT